MWLSDVMSAMRLSHYAEAALVIFLVVFLAVVVRVFNPAHYKAWHEAQLLPLDEDPVFPTKTARATREPRPPTEGAP